jgi:hypothetical protein
MFEIVRQKDALSMLNWVILWSTSMLQAGEGTRGA